jgi:hypothetical protein
MRSDIVRVIDDAGFGDALAHIRTSLFIADLPILSTAQFIEAGSNELLMNLYRERVLRAVV